MSESSFGVAGLGTVSGGCIHYWLIESPNGPTSRGVCKLCGTESDFRNSVQVSIWESEGPDFRQQPHRIIANSIL